MRLPQILVGQADVIEPLVRLLSTGSPVAREEAAVALSNLAIHRANQPMIVEALDVKGEWIGPEGAFQTIVDETLRRSSASSLESTGGLY